MYSCSDIKSQMLTDAFQMTNTVHDLPKVCCFHFLNSFRKSREFCLCSIHIFTWSHVTLGLLFSRRQDNLGTEILPQFRDKCSMEDKTKLHWLIRHSFIPTEYFLQEIQGFRYNTLPSVFLEWEKESTSGR